MFCGRQNTAGMKVCTLVDYPVQRRDKFDVTVADSLRRDTPLTSMVG
jgi:hypothetical protein